MRPMRIIAIIACAALLAGCGKKSNSDVFIVNPDGAEPGVLTEIADDIQIIPLKCDDPIDGLGDLQFTDEYMLAPNNDRSALTLFKDGKYVAKLARSGRGYGEYSHLGSFFLSEDKSSVIVMNDTLLLEYRIPDMTFVGRTPMGGNLSYADIIPIGGDRIISLAVDRDDQESYFRTGLPIRLQKMSDWSIIDTLATPGIIAVEQMGIGQYGLCASEDAPIFLIPGATNRLCMIEADTLRTVFEFSFGDYHMSADLLEMRADPDDEDAEMKMIEKWFEAMEKGKCCGNVRFPLVDGDKVSFVYTTGNNQPDYRIAIFVKSGSESRSYSYLTVPGLNLKLTPDAVNRNAYVCLLEADPAEIIDEDTPLSPLAQDIINALEKQNDFNPILIQFTLK